MRTRTPLALTLILICPMAFAEIDWDTAADYGTVGALGYMAAGNGGRKVTVVPGAAAPVINLYGGAANTPYPLGPVPGTPAPRSLPTHPIRQVSQGRVIHPAVTPPAAGKSQVILQKVGSLFGRKLRRLKQIRDRVVK